MAKKYLFIYILSILGCSISFAQGEAGKTIDEIALGESLVPVRPGKPVVTPFWNTYAERFIYAPAFEMSEVRNASKYRFTIKGSNEKLLSFTAKKPWSALSPVWEKVPEGYTTLLVEGIDPQGRVLGISGQRSFYRSPVFSEKVDISSLPYYEAGKKGLKALFEAPNVQYWLAHQKPDPNYRLYCYPNKVMGGLIRAMAAYSKTADKKDDQEAALQIARLTADYLMSVRTGEVSNYSLMPPTYLVNVDNPYPQAVERTQKQWLMVPSVIDAAFGFLDLYDITKDVKYMNVAKAIAKTLKLTQGANGTWPLMVNSETGRPVHAQELIPTWIIFFFDRLDRQYSISDYRQARARAWQWIVLNPLKTYQWNGQFEDVKLLGPYMNLAREQACDVAVLLLNDTEKNPENMKQAEELLRFAEDQFVVWLPVQDPEGWRKAMPRRLKTPDLWITPCVLEQYGCYEPVARSSAILINAYLEAHKATKKPIYLAKAKGIANGLLAGQAYIEDVYHGTGEIPTWVMKRKPSNWLNNSYYAAEAILNIAEYSSN